MKASTVWLGFLILLAALVWAQPAAACSAPSCAKLIDNGSDAGKIVVVVMGDGYTAAEQAAYNQEVDELVADGVFGNDFFEETHNAFNLYRINLSSAQSGVSTRVWDEQGTPSDASDDVLVSTTLKNTALKYIYSGSWAHCWLEHRFGGAGGALNLTELAKNAALAANGLAHADYIFVILNEAGFGGCNRGPRDIVQTEAVSWQVAAHEAGHGIGGLYDEYSAGRGDYTGGMVNNRNCSTVLNRSSVFWNRFVHPRTPVPTTLGAGMDSNRTVGEFAGCATFDDKIYRPVHNCRMKGNSPEYCPVCQTLMRNALYPKLDHDFERTVIGDFDGDGRDDVLVQHDNDLQIFRADGSAHHLDRLWSANNRVPGASGVAPWILSKGDRLHVADFDGDGRDDLYVLNTTSWRQRWVGMLRSTGSGLETVRKYAATLPGYGWIGAKDQLHVADFDGDGRDDLYLFTAGSWSTKYMGMLRSTGSALATAKRYDGSIPGWIMAAGDRYHVADFNGDGKDDLFVFNGKNWGSWRYLGMLKTSGATLSDIKLYTGTLASGWKMGADDEHFVADIDGDGKDELYVFNGKNWSYPYLELTRSTGGALAYAKRYDGDPATGWAPNIPGWIMTKGDRFFPSDFNKDGKEDLFVYNPKVNWSTEYLGSLASGGSSLTGSWSADWVHGVPGEGGWNLGTADQIQVANFEGGLGRPDLVIRNNQWLGLIRRAPAGFVMDRHYHRWIYTPLHDSKPWALGMP